MTVPTPDNATLNELFDAHRDQLRRMVWVRMDRRLRGRLDESDVLQEAFLEASQRYHEYAESRDVPAFVWLRFLTGQKLSQLHRQHLGTQARDACREVNLFRGAMPEASSVNLAAELIGHQTSPTKALARAEAQAELQAALDAMDAIDREVLTLRYFEHLTIAQSAQVIGISEDAAYKRYVRALKRLQKIVGNRLE